MVMAAASAYYFPRFVGIHWAGLLFDGKEDAVRVGSFARLYYYWSCKKINWGFGVVVML